MPGDERPRNGQHVSRLPSAIASRKRVSRTREDRSWENSDLPDTDGFGRSPRDIALRTDKAMCSLVRYEADLLIR